jgi:hypothetical protein
VNATDRLHQQLRAHVAGLTSPTAAIDLLIAHHTWLRRHDFLDRFTFTATNLDTDTTSTGLDWAPAINALNHDLACSGGEARLLRIAASLAQGTPVDLRDAMTGLDHTNTTLVAKAITQAAGH